MRIPIRLIIRMISVFSIMTFALCRSICAQEDMRQNLDLYLYTSCFIMDKGNINYCNLESIVNATCDISNGKPQKDKIYDSTNMRTFLVPRWDSAWITPAFKESDYSYKIQLFKIETHPIISKYYILYVKACFPTEFNFQHDLWLRVYGFRENDLKIFFDALREQGISKKDIKKMVNDWSNSDSLFNEIDWECLLKGYFSNNTHCDCYISNAYWEYWSLYAGERQDALKRDIYSKFSTIPLGGRISFLR